MTQTAELDETSVVPASSEKLFPVCYEQLRAMARQRLCHERVDHTLSATALVHEVHLRLFGESHRDFENNSDFFLAAAQAMRRILIEHARKRRRLKRGGDRQRVMLDAMHLAREADSDQIVAVDEAICRLKEQDPRVGEIVHLRFFADLSEQETAEALGISERTVRREWKLAKAWLHRELGGHEE